MTEPSSPTPVTPPAADAFDPPVASPSRRGLLWGVAGLAALAGAGAAWWRLQPHEVAPGAADALWGLQLDTPGGSPLALRSFAGKPLLVNFWATWCPPCVDELPMLNTFYKEHAAHGWQVVGIAIDQPSAVRNFLGRLPLDFPVVLAGLGGTDLARSLGNEKGGLPFTVVLDAKGAIVQRKMGQVTTDDLSRWKNQG